VLASAYRETFGEIVPISRSTLVMYSHDHLDHTVRRESRPKADLGTRALRANCDGRGATPLPITEVFHGERRLVDIDDVRVRAALSRTDQATEIWRAYSGPKKLFFVGDLMLRGAAYRLPGLASRFVAKAFQRFLGLDWDIWYRSFWPLTREYVSRHLRFSKRRERLPGSLRPAIDRTTFLRISLR